MPGPGARTGSDEEFVEFAGGDDLIDERIYRGTTAVDDALPTYLDHGSIRENPEVRRPVHRARKLGIGKRTLHQERL